MKIRTIKNQLNYVISQNCRIGESKRAYKNNASNSDKQGQVFSVQYAENLRDTANQFAGFINKNHPEIRLANDIKECHVQEWIDEKSAQWSQKTVDNKISQMKVIFQQMGNTFGRNDVDININKPKTVKAHTIRNVAFSKDDIELLRQEMAERTTEGKKAVEIAYRCGLRSKEIARLHSSCINTDKWVLEVREGAKNGRDRDVPIRERDRAYFANLKAETAGDYVCHGVSEESLNKAVRRALSEIGLSEKYRDSTIHAIRKAYATERMMEERQNQDDERKAWEVVQQELGHGNRFRQNLYNTYVKG